MMEAHIDMPVRLYGAHPPRLVVLAGCGRDNARLPSGKKLPPVSEDVAVLATSRSQPVLRDP